MSCSIFKTFFMILISVLCLGESINFIGRKDCKKDEYFDLELLQCIGCNKNLSLIVSQRGHSCVCDKHSRTINYDRYGHSVCVTCKQNEMLSIDGAACVPRKCSTKNGKSGCIACGANQISVTRNPDGSIPKEVKCVTCAPGSQPSSDKPFCIPCTLKNASGVTCRCNDKTAQEISKVCVEKSFIKSKGEYLAKNLEGIWRKSDWMNMLALEFLCQKNEWKACRRLSHLCVFSLYEEDQNGPCGIWMRSQNQKDITKLLYGENDVYAILNQKLLNANFSFTSDTYNKQLQLVIAKFNTNGESVEYDRKLTILPSLCQTGGRLYMGQFQFGRNYKISCILQPSQLLDLDENYVFETFLLYQNDTDKSHEIIHSLPVAIRIKDSDYIKNNEKTLLKLYRRFFIIYKSKDNGGNTTDPVQAIFLSKIKIMIGIHRASPDGSNKILTPIMYLTYETITKNDVLSSKEIKISFEIINKMEKDSFVKSMEIAIGVLSVLALGYSLIRGWAHAKRTSIEPNTGVTVWRFLLYATFNIGNVLYVVTFCVCLNNMIVYSYQRVVYALPPTRKEELFVESFIVSSFTIKLLEVLWVNYRQINCDIFLLDWNQASQSTLNEELDHDSWPMLSIGRRWCSSQTVRWISVPTQLAITLTILELTPESTSSVTEPKCYQFAYTTSIWLCVYLACLVTSALLRRFGLSPSSISWTMPTNVSLLVFQDAYYAHYIHDRCVPIVDERGFKSVQRQGFLPGLPYWNFSVCCGQNFKILFFRLYDGWLSEEQYMPPSYVKGQTTSTAKLTSRSMSIESIDEYVTPSEVNKTYSRKILNRFMASFLHQALDGVSWSVRPRGWLERLLGIELGVGNEYSGQTMFLYNPQVDDISYSSLLWYGEEWTLATFDLFLFSFVIFFSRSTLLAGVVVFFTWQTMKFVRNHLSRRNFSRKTGIHSSKLA